MRDGFSLSSSTYRGVATSLLPLLGASWAPSCTRLPCPGAHLGEWKMVQIDTVLWCSWQPKGDSPGVPWQVVEEHGLMVRPCGGVSLSLGEEALARVWRG